MDAEDFLNNASGRRVLERAGRIANARLVVHQHVEGDEAELQTQCGGCAEACAHVTTLPWGPQSCRRSRTTAAASAIRRAKPIPFVCHMGFSCVSIAIDPPGLQNPSVLTLGPFCPSEAPDSLALEAREGLQRIDPANPSDLPFTLDDIPVLSAAAAPELAEWIAETLRAEAAAALPTDHPSEDVIQGTKSHRQRRLAPGAIDYHIGDILAALSASDTTQARRLVQRAIEGVCAPERSTLQVRQASAIALVAAVLQAAERTDMDTAKAKAAFATFSTEAYEAPDATALSRLAMSTLRHLRADDKMKRSGSAALSLIVDRNLLNGITLAAAASELGEKPSTLTRRLQRTIGMSFSEFVARRRVDRAKELLISTSLRVSDIAVRVGLNDASNLGKLFRKFERLSPSEYRKRSAKEHRTKRTGTNP